VPRQQLFPSGRSVNRARGYRLWVGGPVPPKADGITIGKTVIVRRASAERETFGHLLRHELAHVEQFRDLGTTRFVRQYVGEYLQGRRRGLSHHNAYLAISLEVAARNRADKCQPSPPSSDDVAATHRAFEHRFLDAARVRHLPSRLPNWTVGHVLAHLTLNAEALTRVMWSLAQDTPVPGMMYGSAEERSAGIERTSRLDMNELHDRLQRAHRAMETHLHQGVHLIDNGVGQAFPNAPTFAAADIPLRRLREVEVHSHDVGLRTYTYHNWPAAYVDADVHHQLHDIPNRLTSPIHVIDEYGVHHSAQPSGVAGAAELLPAVHVPRRTLLAWMLSRTDTPLPLPPIGAW
jgi:maleylpyruvate isomerase